GLVGRLAGLAGEGDGVDAGGLVTDAGVADAVEVGGDTLDDGGGAGLLFDARAVVALAEGFVLEEAVGAGGGIAPVAGDGTVGETTGETDVAPGVDLFAAESIGAGENTVNLDEAQALDGVVLVGVNGEGVDGDFDLGGLVAVFLFEGVDLGTLHGAAHRAELRGAFDEGDRGGGGALALDLDVDV